MSDLDERIVREPELAIVRALRRIDKISDGLSDETVNAIAAVISNTAAREAANTVVKKT
ncbi:hypothetical protein PQU92_18730 [Asticcacaulis sp. BYS171W]|uniref:Uncharacterized protein n=1 Tax=Asticcacaulis aquaticus TaxID=2984212 RepID=A0ABT5HZ27_9CAUL|nr:hypothetical protein [Asticcacaulis aquaticus]MDC7685318.1 hypothetical protein [Asticcacaulis aquaticus]